MVEHPILLSRSIFFNLRDVPAHMLVEFKVVRKQEVLPFKLILEPHRLLDISSIYKQLATFLTWTPEMAFTMVDLPCAT